MYWLLCSSGEVNIAPEWPYFFITASKRKNTVVGKREQNGNGMADLKGINEKYANSLPFYQFRNPQYTFTMIWEWKTVSFWWKTSVPFWFWVECDMVPTTQGGWPSVDHLKYPRHDWSAIFWSSITIAIFFSGSRSRSAITIMSNDRRTIAIAKTRSRSF